MWVLVTPLLSFKFFYNFYDEDGVCYHQPFSCLCEVDPGWMVEGQATKEVEPRLPRLPNGWLSRQSGQSSLYVIQVQDNNGGDPDLLPTGEIGPRHQIRSSMA